MKLIQEGKDVPDPEERYKQLKAIEPIIKQKYESGEISKQKYETFIKTIEMWEKT